jgi:hypothetical protein
VLIPENVSDYLPLNGPLLDARAIAVTVSIDSLHSEPACTKPDHSSVSWHAVQVARLPAKVERDSIQTNVSYWPTAAVTLDRVTTAAIQGTTDANVVSGGG